VRADNRAWSPAKIWSPNAKVWSSEFKENEESKNIVCDTVRGVAGCKNLLKKVQMFIFERSG